MIKFTADIVPVTFKRPDSNQSRRFDPDDYAAFKDQLGYIALQHMRGLKRLERPVRLYAEVFRPVKPESLNFGDWDNHGKAISDALNGICYKDDRQIVDGHIKLLRGDPRINIVLEALL